MRILSRMLYLTKKSRYLIKAHGHSKENGSHMRFIPKVKRSLKYNRCMLKNQQMNWKLLSRNRHFDGRQLV